MTTTIHAHLPLPCGAILPNRIAKSATSEALADPASGSPRVALENLYERWGAGGAGLLITGNVIIDLDGRTEPGNVRITDDSHLAELSRWVAAAEQGGAKLWMQINHAGRQSPRSVTRNPVAPSVVPLKGFAGLFAKPRELTSPEIEALIERFANASSIAKQAGFSGVQIHAAHGYLISQFLSPRSNQRDDEWGGDPNRRMELLRRVVRRTRERVGASFPIGVKLNSADFQRGGFSEEESMDVVSMLEAEGIDLLEISGGSYEKSAMMGDAPGARESTRKREAYFLDYAKKVRARTSLPLLLTGGMRSVAVMNDAIGGGHVDMVGMARPLIVEPDLPRRLLDGTATEAIGAAPRSRIKLFDDMLQIVWYQAQIRRMGRGVVPNPSLRALPTLLSGIRHNYAFNPLRSLWPNRDKRTQLSAEVA